MSRPSVFSDINLDVAKTAGEGPTAATVTSPAPAPAKPDKDIIKTSTYLPREVHEILREIAFHERTKIHDLLVEGVDHILKTRRHPTVAELKARRDNEAA